MAEGRGLGPVTKVEGSTTAGPNGKPPTRRWMRRDPQVSEQSHGLRVLSASCADLLWMASSLHFSAEMSQVVFGAGSSLESVVEGLGSFEGRLFSPGGA